MKQLTNFEICEQVFKQMGFKSEGTTYSDIKFRHIFSLFYEQLKNTGYNGYQSNARLYLGQMFLFGKITEIAKIKLNRIHAKINVNV